MYAGKFHIASISMSQDTAKSGFIRPVNFRRAFRDFKRWLDHEIDAAAPMRKTLIGNETASARAALAARGHELRRLRAALAEPMFLRWLLSDVHTPDLDSYERASWLIAQWVQEQLARTRVGDNRRDILESVLEVLGTGNFGHARRDGREMALRDFRQWMYGHARRFPDLRSDGVALFHFDRIVEAAEAIADLQVDADVHGRPFYARDFLEAYRHCAAAITNALRAVIGGMGAGDTEADNRLCWVLENIDEAFNADTARRRFRREPSMGHED